MGEHLMALSRLGVRQRMAFSARLAEEEWATDVLLRPPTFGVLRVISRSVKISQAEAAALLGLHPSDMVTLIDGLERGGWVSRLRSNEDRRRYNLMLTAEGWTLLRRMELIADEVEQAFLSVLSPIERANLDDIVDRLMGEHFSLGSRGGERAQDHVTSWIKAVHRTATQVSRGERGGAVAVIDARPATTAQTLASAPPRVTRKRLLIAFGVVLAIFVALAGIPQDRTEVVIGVLLLALILAYDGSFRTAWPAMRDVVAIAAIFFLYDRGRGAADSLFHAHTTLPIDVDKLLGFGSVPTIWLQHHLLLGHAQWWEPLPSFVYMSHFIAPLVVTMLVRVKAKHLWRMWLNRFLSLSTIVLVIYVLVPWTPPWLDAQEGHLPTVQRTVSRGLGEAGLAGAGKLFHEGAAYSNQVAAMPSLHTAYPTLYLLFFWPLAKHTWQRVLLAIYPLAMGFSLVLTGEHWVSDVLAAYALVPLVHFGFRRWERRRDVAAAPRP